MDLAAISTGSATKPRSVRTWRWLGAACLVAVATTVVADPKLLPPEQAFRFSARALDDRTLEARFEVTDGYYLYRDKLKFALDPGMTDLTPSSMPAGKVKEDQFFGKVETYRGDVVVRVPLPAASPGKPVVLAADSQGCAAVGVGYHVNRQ